MAIFSRKKSPIRQRSSRRQGDRLSSDTTTGYSSQRHAFQRNRTLTGSASSDVKGVSEAKADLKSPRVRTHQLALLRRRVGLGLLVVVVIAAGLAGLVSQFTSEPVVVSSVGSQAQHQDYRTIIEQYFKNQPIERLRFMLDEQSLTQHVKSNAPEVLAIKQQGSAGFGKTEFNIVMRTPVAGWSIDDSQQYVDETGIAFSKNYYPEPSVEIVDQSGIELSAGQTVLSNRFLSFVGQLVGLTEANDYTVTKVIIPPSTTRQVEVDLKGVEYPIRLSIDREVGVQVEDMVRAIEWLDRRNQSPKYVDVRVSGRAFYR